MGKNKNRNEVKINEPEHKTPEQLETGKFAKLSQVINNYWFVTVLGGILVALVVYWITQCYNNSILENKLISDLAQAQSLYDDKLYEESITICQKILDIASPTKFEPVFAQTCFCLARSYSNLSDIKETRKNLHFAKTYIDKSLVVYTPRTYKKEYADSMAEKGRIYLKLSHISNYKGNANESVVCLMDSCRNYDELGLSFDSENYNNTVIDLAIACAELGIALDVKDTSNYEAEALTYLCSLLSEVQDIKLLPQETQNKLIDYNLLLFESYPEESSGDISRLLDGQIYLNSILSDKTGIDDPNNWTLYATNISHAYYLKSLYDKPNKPFLLVESINWMSQAKKSLADEKYKSSPKKGLILYRLGKANLELYITDKTPPRLLDRAEESFKDALLIFSISEFPMNYALTQYELGNTYKQKWVLTGDVQYLLSSADCYGEAKNMLNSTYPFYYKKIEKELNEELTKDQRNRIIEFSNQVIEEDPELFASLGIYPTENIN